MRLLGVIAILLTWVAMAVLVTKWRGHRAMTLSQHAASEVKAYVFFAVGLTIGGLLFGIFAFKWLVPTYKLSQIFEILLIIGLVCQFITAWIPDTLGKMRKLHRWSAYTEAWLLLPLILILITSKLASTPLRIIGILGVIYMLTTIVGSFYYQPIRRRVLIFQMLYAVTFHLIILGAIFLR